MSSRARKQSLAPLTRILLQIHWFHQAQVCCLELCLNIWMFAVADQPPCHYYIAFVFSTAKQLFLAGFDTNPVQFVTAVPVTA